MPSQFIQEFELREREVRREYRSVMRREPQTSRELLEWIDSQIAATKFRDDTQAADAAKRYGAVLGQVLVRDHGGEWVTVVDASGQKWPGVRLAKNVAFVFNRVAKRISGQSDVGVVGTYDATIELETGSGKVDVGTRPWNPNKDH
jgi:hypothetical protein